MLPPRSFKWLADLCRRYARRRDSEALERLVLPLKRVNRNGELAIRRPGNFEITVIAMTPIRQPPSLCTAKRREDLSGLQIHQVILYSVGKIGRIRQRGRFAPGQRSQINFVFLRGTPCKGITAIWRRRVFQND